MNLLKCSYDLKTCSKHKYFLCTFANIRNKDSMALEDVDANCDANRPQHQSFELNSTCLTFYLNLLIRNKSRGSKYSEGIYVLGAL